MPLLPKRRMREIAKHWLSVQQIHENAVNKHIELHPTIVTIATPDQQDPSSTTDNNSSATNVSDSVLVGQLDVDDTSYSRSLSSSLTGSDSGGSYLLGVSNGEKRPPQDVTKRLHTLIALSAQKTNYSEEREQICFQDFRDTLEDALFDDISRSKNVDLNTRFVDNNHKACTLLHTAARTNAVLIMNYLIDTWMVDVNCVDKMDSTPLYYACASGHERACATLLFHSANPNVRDQYENFPLLVAFRNHNLHCCKSLLLSGADINFGGKKGDSCLHYACETGNMALLEFLFTSPKNDQLITVNKNRQSQTPLFLALPHPHIVQALLARMLADSAKSSLTDSAATFAKWLKMTDDSGQSVFHVCAEKGYIDSLVLLVNSSTDELITEVFAQQDKLRQSTPLHLAATHQQVDAIKLLILSSEIDMDAKNKNGETAMHLLVQAEQPKLEIIELVMNLGLPSLAVRNSSGVTVKKLATKNNIDLFKIKGEQAKEKTVQDTMINNVAFVPNRLLSEVRSRLGNERRASKRIEVQNRSWTKNRDIVLKLNHYQGSDPLNPDQQESKTCELIEWSEALSVGIEWLDVQHQKLIDMTNQLYVVCTEQHISTNRQTTALILGSLLEYVRSQFNNEIRLMNYHFRKCTKDQKKLLEDHEKDHDRLKGTVRIFHQRFEQGADNDFFEMELLNMLVDFIKNHIIEKDKALYKQVAHQIQVNIDYM